MARHVVVDGSNIATEGRPSPSLRQLNEAVLAFMEENPGDTITVVVDATFGHRIDPKEVAEFNEAVENNEIVAPPAGAVGRGDGFVLAIADKKKASVLSNDSYQEFHGQYTWLFDEGRLIGGKPIPPDREWVFINRVPVRGPVSRKAVKDAKRKGGSSRPTKASKEANQPMPVPKAPPPGATVPSGRRGRGKGEQRAAEAKPAMASAAPTGAASAPADHTNDLLAFLSFVEHHPVGSTVRGEVSSYSSHGAYVKVGDVFGYVPMRMMSSPPPRSAREKMALGDTVDLVVVGFNPGRRGIDMALPGMAPELATSAAPAKKSATKSPATKAAATKKAAPKKAATKATAATKVLAKKADAPTAAKKTAVKKSAAKKSTATPASKPTAKKATAPKAAAKKAPAAKKPVAKVPAAKKTAAKKIAAKKVTAKKAVAATAAKKTPAKKTAAKKAR